MVSDELKASPRRVRVVVTGHPFPRLSAAYDGEITSSGAGAGAGAVELEDLDTKCESQFSTGSIF